MEALFFSGSNSRQAQKFPPIHDQLANFFHHSNPEHHSSSIRRAHRSGGFAAWREVMAASLAA
ncbi:MAG: hypothetical protein WA733_15925 [Methylocystis sp.]